jgi:hypothetical protein
MSDMRKIKYSVVYKVFGGFVGEKKYETETCILEVNREMNKKKEIAFALEVPEQDVISYEKID